MLGLAVAALSRIPKTLAGAAIKEIGSIVAGLLQMDLVDLLVSGWRKHGALASAAELTLRSPGEKQVVGLATHRIRSTHTPSIELVVDRVPLGEVNFLIELGADVHALRAFVSGGADRARLGAYRAQRDAVVRGSGAEVVPPRDRSLGRIRPGGRCAADRPLAPFVMRPSSALGEEPATRSRISIPSGRSRSPCCSSDSLLPTHQMF